MPTSVAKPADVVARWRPLSPNQETVAQTRLADVERQIRRRMTKVGRSLTDELAADDLLAVDDPDKVFRDTLVEVEVLAVLRVLKNPEGLRSESFDDYSRTRDRASSDGELRVTAEEWAKLGLPATDPKTSTRKAFMVDTTPPAAVAVDVGGWWCR
jgi:hypothetical protein